MRLAESNHGSPVIRRFERQINVDALSAAHLRPIMFFCRLRVHRRLSHRAGRFCTGESLLAGHVAGRQRTISGSGPHARRSGSSCDSRCWSPCAPKPISRVALHHHLPAQNLRCEAVALCDGRRLHTRQVRRPRQLPDDMGRKSAPDCCALRCPPLARPWALPRQRSNLDS